MTFQLRPEEMSRRYPNKDRADGKSVMDSDLRQIKSHKLLLVSREQNYLGCRNIQGRMHWAKDT